MKELGGFLSNLIEKFDIKKLTICVFVVLALMLIPNINFLGFIMPLDNAEKWIIFVFCLITVYLALSTAIFLWSKIKVYFKYKPKNLFWMMGNYSEYINIFYSEAINEYSGNDVDFLRYNVSKDVIYKLMEKNIIECVGYNYPTYRLTQKARKKLNRMRKVINFINSKFINKKTSDRR